MNPTGRLTGRPFTRRGHMLADHQRQLLTAAVDGELTPRQRRLVERLLAESPEAARFYRRLQRDAERLRRMPTRAPAADLSEQVMAVILAQGPLRRRRPPVQPWVRPALFANAVAAAAVLLAVGFVSYLYFQSLDGSGRPTAAVTPPSKLTPKIPATDEVVRVDPTPERLPAPREADDEPLVVVVDGGRTASHGTNPEPPQPPKGPPDVIAAPPGSPIELQEVQLPRLPFLADAADLQKPEVRVALADDWRKEEFSRFDLFCHDTSRAAELLTAALGGAGVKALVEPGLAERLKKKEPARLVYLCDALTPEELAKVFEGVTAVKKGEKSPFDRFVATPVTLADRKDLAGLLGVDLLRPRPAAAKGPLTGDPRKPVSEGTADQVAGLLSGSAGQGGASPGVASKPPERPALALPYPTTRVNAAGVAEVRKYLETRGERKAGSVGLVLVVRPTKG